MKWLMEPVAVALGIIIVIVAVMLFGGFYLKFTQAPITPTPTPVTPVVTEIPTEIPTTEETPPPTPEVTLPPPPTTPPGSYAVAAKPYDDKKYYKLPYRSTVYDPRASMPPVIFSTSYEGKFQSEGVVVHVVRPPLLIDYSLTSAQSPTRSFFFLTVRNNETQELLAQDGFLGPYSEDRMKRLTFSAAGDYHINMYGGFVGVQLNLRAPPG